MMKLLKFSTYASSALLAFAIASNASAQTDLSGEKKQFSYTFGVQIGKDLAQGDILNEIDKAALIQGLKDVINKQNLQLSEEQMQAAIQGFQAKQLAKYQKLVADNKAKGEKFLAENKAKSKKVKVTDSGLQYEVLRKGKGKNPTTEDIVSVNYVGSFPNGEEFDKNKEPVDFDLSAGLIEGMKEGVQLMKPGAKYRFTIPANLAYGEKGSRIIGPNQVLVFEVELLHIKQ